MSAIIKIKNLSKKFKDLTAVNKINLAINKGEIFGLLGPNGAGKTTTISMLSTLLKPSSGTAVVNGYDIGKHPAKVRDSMGVVFQDSVVDSDLTAYDNLDFHARLYKIPNDLKEKRIKEVIELVNLSEYLKKPVETFSGGMKRRLEIARGFLHHPKVLFLDEPTLGLDPQTRRHIWDYILQLRKRENITIVLTTHYLEEADFLCDRIAIIDHGKIIVLGEPGQLKNRLRGDVIKIKLSRINVNIVKMLKRIKAKKLDIVNNEISIVTKNAESKIAGIVDILKRSNHSKIESIFIHKPTLEDVFLYYTGKEIR